METEDYCPHLNSCIETKRDICYGGYIQCGFYERRQIVTQLQEQDKGLVKKVAVKLGNPHDRNLQL